MIHFALRCENGHNFESWFKSSSAFEKLLAGGMIGCAICGSSQVEKAPMAPRLNAGRPAGDAPADSGDAARRPLADPASPTEQALAAMRRRIEAHSHYVGQDFARQARAMHDGEAPAREIHGEASAGEARALLDDGVPVLPLPFRPRDKSN